MCDGILYELMLERTSNLPKDREWMMRRDNQKTSKTIQGVIIAQFAHSVQRTVVSRAPGCDFYGLRAVSPTGISTVDQFSCCVQHVDRNLETLCDFFRISHYRRLSTTDETLSTCLKDILVRLNIPIAHLQGYCSDGSSSMSGRLPRVQAWLKEVSPHSSIVCTRLQSLPGSCTSGNRTSGEPEGRRTKLYAGCCCVYLFNCSSAQPEQVFQSHIWLWRSHRQHSGLVPNEMVFV